MAQAQGVAKLMNSHSKQVRPLTIWGRRKTGLELYPSPTPEKKAARKPPEGGLRAEGQLDGGRPSRHGPTPGSTPRPLPESPSFLGAFTYSGGFFLVAWSGSSGHLGTGPETRRTGQGRGRRRWPGQRKGWPSCRSPGPQERKPVHSETLWGKREPGGARGSPEEAPALESPSFGMPSGARCPHPQGMSLSLLGPGFPRRSPLSRAHGAPLPPPTHAPLAPTPPSTFPGASPVPSFRRLPRQALSALEAGLVPTLSDHSLVLGDPAWAPGGSLCPPPAAGRTPAPRRPSGCPSAPPAPRGRGSETAREASSCPDVDVPRGNL